MFLGEQIKKNRININLTQEELAKKISVTKDCINLWETNQTEPSVTELIKLSKIFNVPINHLCEEPFLAQEGYLSSGITVYDHKFIKAFSCDFFDKKIITSITFALILIVSGLFTIILSELEVKVPFGILFIIIGIFSLIRSIINKGKLKKLYLQMLNKESNKTFRYYFYHDYIDIEMKSDVSVSKNIIYYNNIDQIIEKDDYIYFLYLNKYYAIDKKYLDNISLALTLLKSEIKNKKTTIQNKGKSPNEKNKTIKILSLITFILTVFTLPLALMIFALTQKSGNFHDPSQTVEHIWVMIFALPIPLSSIVLGFIARRVGIKYKKNLILGFIMAGSVIVYSSMTLIFKNEFSHDYTYINKIENRIEFDLPDIGRISTEDWSKRSQSTTLDDAYINYISYVTFFDADEIESFTESVQKSALWTSHIITENKGMLCSQAAFQFADYNYYIIYNLTLTTFNSLPPESGTYDFIFLGYNHDRGTMLIIEYRLDISLE
ncbi:MAG: helix-turn-helix transcriptional regulator [Bacilli bacterium]|nr:helix-turn-helix transcriptional regulator [Bacilli bacterium]